MQLPNFDPRQQMNGASFELQHKRDTALTHVELHHHDFYEISFLISGDVTFVVESRVYRALPGDLLLISPQELHQVQINPETSAYERYVLWVAPDAIAQLARSGADLSQYLDAPALGRGNQLRPDEHTQQLIHSLLESLYREVSEGGFGSRLLQNSLLTQFLILIGRLSSREDQFREQVIRDSKPVSQVISYISSHYQQPLSLDQLARQVCVSKYHLSHEFQRLVGTSVYRYLQKKRLLMACRMLAEGLKPNQICARCGFGDYAGFYRAFRAEYGLSPRTYGQMCREKNSEISLYHTVQNKKGAEK